MQDFKNIYRWAEKYFNDNRVRLVILVLAGLFLVLLSVEGWLNIWVRSSLKDSLGWGKDPKVKISADLNWLTLFDIAQGKIRWVRVKGENCIISNIRFTSLNFQNGGFTFNLSLLLTKQRLQLLSIGATTVEATVTAKSFSEYLNLLYPQLKPGVKIYPGEFLISSEAKLFEKEVPVQLAGELQISGPKNLRFYPTRLIISGRTVPKDFLRFLGNQIPLEFTLMEDWPLEVKEVTLKRDLLFLSFKEINYIR